VSLDPQHPRNHQRVVAGRHHRQSGLPWKTLRCNSDIMSKQLGNGSLLVDREIVDHRVHGEWERIDEICLHLKHQLQQRCLCLCLPLGVKDETHPAARHTTEHPEAPEVRPKELAHAIDQGGSIKVVGPGYDRLNRAEEVAGRRLANGRDRSCAEHRHNVVKQLHRFLPRTPLGAGAQQVLLRHHLEDRPHVLCHATMNEDQALL